MAEIQLLTSENSNCSQRVAWALNYKKLSYKTIDSQGISQENLVKLSPLGKVPAIVTEHGPMAESMAIIEYLDNEFPEKALFPKNHYERAKVREICEMVNGTIHAVQSNKVAKFYIPGVTPEETTSFRRKWIELHLPKLQPLLFQKSPYAFGTSFTAADIFVLPIFAKTLGFHTPPHQYPAFLAHLEHCRKNPEAWESCPANLKSALAALNLV